MEKTRKISMIPEFLKNRKTYILSAIVFSIIGVLGLSFAFFRFSRDANLTSQNVVMVETITVEDVTKSFTVSYEKNNASLETGILDISSTYSDIMKFKVESNHSDYQIISINWNFITSTLTKSATSYELYSCSDTNFINVTVDNVSSLCTSIGPTTGNVLPNSNEKYKLTSADNIMLPAEATQYYVAKINIEASNTGNSFTGTIAVKHTKYSTLTLNLDDGEISCSIVSDMPFGDSRTIPIPTKPGYIFSGWVIDGESDSVVNGYTFTMGTSDTTLIATWTQSIRNYSYTGGVQSFIAPQTGVYNVEAWGAQGGTHTSTDIGGYGAYTQGEIYLEKNETLYVYVGSTTTTVNGGYNGGGGATAAYGKGGGGATDIRFFNSNITSADLIWNSILGLNSRIMVAAGGGGGGHTNSVSGSGGGGGGLEGTTGQGSGFIANVKALQTFAGSCSSVANTVGSFGIGGSTLSSGTGGGGGYYGGGAGYTSGAPGGGGSSYISGHVGSNSIQSGSSRIHTGNAIHYTGKYFLNTKMIDGQGYSWSNVKNGLIAMPNHSGGTYASKTGNTGNGFARISFINYNEKNESVINAEKLIIEEEMNYTFSNNYQVFTTPQTGMYKIETWGAQGGTTSSTDVGGYGAYTKGVIYLEKDVNLYVYVGQQPINTTGGYNGGGSASGAYGKGGGGATDIRFFISTPNTASLSWNNDIGLNNRIMIAAGGGGSGHTNSVAGSGGGGGGLNGTTGQGNGFYANVIATLTTAGYCSSVPNTVGSFGVGGTTTSSGTGGGGGYYGGGAGYTSGAAGGGGSSYISGHPGSISINDLDESISPRTILNGCTASSTTLECSYHKSLTARTVSNGYNKYFIQTLMIDGNGYGWTTTKSSTKTQMSNPRGGIYIDNGHQGNGFARISFIS